MPKTITSPVKRFPGTVVIPDFLTVPQATAWEQAQRAALVITDAHRDDKTVDGKRDSSYIHDVELIAAWIPGVTAVVDEWALEGFSHDPFQTTPRAAVIRLIAWLIGEIAALYEDVDDIPNG